MLNKKIKGSAMHFLFFVYALKHTIKKGCTVDASFLIILIIKDYFLISV